jgi:hypothetical protein
MVGKLYLKISIWYWQELWSSILVNIVSFSCILLVAVFIRRVQTIKNVTIEENIKNFIKFLNGPDVNFACIFFKILLFLKKKNQRISKILWGDTQTPLPPLAPPMWES